MEYRHGPISVSGPGTVVWSLGPLDPALAEQIRSVGATAVDLGVDPLASLVVAQRTAVALAESRGLDPDTPHNLTRAVILDEPPAAH
jgi:fructoselysine-6-P-deglycase FrlB-like protein